MQTVEWVQELPGKVGRGSPGKYAQERAEAQEALRGNPGMWGRLRKYDDPKPARMAALRYRDDGYSFAVRKSGETEWSLWGRYNTPEQNSEEDARPKPGPRRGTRKKTEDAAA